MKFKSIGYIASNSNISRAAFLLLTEKYKNIIDLKKEKREVDLIIVLGGDGFMLHSLHQYMHLNVPFYGMNSGTIGFLMNNFKEDNLLERIERAELFNIHPLKMTITLNNNKKFTSLAINEVYLFRQTNQAAKIKISVDGSVRLAELIGDGIIVSTPAGSSAYNFSAGGPIIPINSKILSMTPLSAFRPRRWRGALLPHTVKINFEILDHFKRPVSAVADFNEFRNIVSVDVEEAQDKQIKLLFDSSFNLDDRILKEQFS